MEATHSQNKEDFISACENAFYYYGGVPQAVVPDNLKAAVTKAGRHEFVLNEEFERFAEHYGVTVFPARVRKPKDKALVENAVKLTYKDIYTTIESLHCPDLKSLNAAIRSALELHNNGTLPGRNYSGRTYFEDIKRDASGPLNPIRYQVKKQVSATVGKDGYIRLRDDVPSYSVPYTYIGKKLTIRYTSSDFKAASFRYNASLADIDYSFERGLDQNQVERLAALAFVKESKDFFITGPAGTGKSYLSTALGNKACQEAYRVLYASTAKLMSSLKIGKVKGTILTDLKRIERTDLLILDDFCMQSFDSQSRGILMDIIEDRHQKRSTIITSQLPVKNRVLIEK